MSSINSLDKNNKKDNEHSEILFLKKILNTQKLLYDFIEKYINLPYNSQNEKNYKYQTFLVLSELLKVLEKKYFTQGTPNQSISNMGMVFTSLDASNHSHYIKEFTSQMNTIITSKNSNNLDFAIEFLSP